MLDRIKRWLLAMLENRQAEVSADFLRVAPVPPLIGAARLTRSPPRALRNPSGRRAPRQYDAKTPPAGVEQRAPQAVHKAAPTGLVLHRPTGLVLLRR